MKKEHKIKFPKGFFQLKRTTITTSEALKDVIPIKWDNVKLVAPVQLRRPRNRLNTKQIATFPNYLGATQQDISNDYPIFIIKKLKYFKQ